MFHAAGNRMIRHDGTDDDVENDSGSPTYSRPFLTKAEERPTKLPIHAPPERTSSQERFRSLSSITTPLADSPHTISTPKDMSLLFSHLQNMSDEDLNRLPDDVYKRYIKEKADKIVQKVVPESFDRLVSEQIVPPLRDDLTCYPGFPKQSTLYPLAKDQLEIGKDGRYFETRNYNRVEDLGEGGFGMVYACMDTGNENLFAIKCNNQSNSEKVSSMRRECEVLFCLGYHGNITRFLGSLLEDYGGEVQGQSLKMLMECAINGSLDDMLIDPETQSYGYGLQLNQALYYLQQILCGVNFLHQRSTLHLDLKCKNILVFDEGRTVKLTDFGTAMKKEEISMKGSLVGYTPNYSAPEVVNGSELPSYSADIWSVMCVLVEMLTGKTPWCSEHDHTPQTVILMVGNYNESNDFEKLAPYKDYEMTEDVVDLMKQVLIIDSKMRPSARDLLQSQVMIEAVKYEMQFDDLMGDIEEEEEHYEECDKLTPIIENYTKAQSFPSTFVNQRISVDSGIGRSLPDRLSSIESNNPSPLPPRTPSLTTTQRYQIFRHESAPFLSIPAKNMARFEEISSHFSNNSNTTTIPSGYVPKGVLHSISAPPDIWSSPQRVQRMIPRGDDDSERDGPYRGILKRNPSAQYVSNGPEVDSPDGRRVKLPPPTSPMSNGTVSVGTQTSLSPTIEGVPLFPGPQPIYYYSGSQSSVRS